LSDSSKIAGSGYESFFYLLDSSRPNVPAYLESQTYFVHNDYLQTLLELGIPGLLVLLVLVVLPVAYAWRVASRRAAAPGEMAMLFAVVAALGSMAVHALGDFPFYVPICVLLYGAALGILESIAVKARCAREIRLPAAIAGGTLRRVVVAGAGTIIAWILVLPAAAEGAAEYGLRHWRAGQGREAAWGLETARRLDSRDWRYHWYAGKFWSMQADSKADKAAAALADRALAAGVAANPREVRPLYDRLVLHERLGPLLRDPADTGTLLAWAERIVALAPADPVVRAERDRVVARFGAAKEGAAK
jgi:hypothetical protein